MCDLWNHAYVEALTEVRVQVNGYIVVKKRNWMSRVQFLDLTVCVSLSGHALAKTIDLSLFFPHRLKRWSTSYDRATLNATNPVASYFCNQLIPKIVTLTSAWAVEYTNCISAEG